MVQNLKKPDPICARRPHITLLTGVYHYEFMDDWEKFNENTLPEKEEFYSNLNMEDIIDTDHMHATRA